MDHDSPDGAAVGLIVNPIAGLGGSIAARGTDPPAVVRSAMAAGALPQAGLRAERAMRVFRANCTAPILAGPGPLGEAAAAGGEVVALPQLTGTAADTAALVTAMQGRVKLILFCGGDGTARDVTAANAAGLPILGIPAGVKMHSGVFCRTPERAGLAASAFLADPERRVELVEVMDIDEAARRSGRLSARLYAVARTPAARGARQGTKAGSCDVIAELDAALAAYVARMEPATAYIIGPGTTMAALKERLGGGTLLGVDLARDGRIVARDVDERGILDVVAAAPAARIVLTVIGGQGFLLGRGNQQISAEVVRRLGREQIDVICAAGKLVPPELSVDTGDAALDAALTGYWQVRTGPARRQVVRVTA